MFGSPATQNTTSGPCNSSKIFLWIFGILFLTMAVYGLLSIMKDNNSENLPDWVKDNLPTGEDLLSVVDPAKEGAVPVPVDLEWLPLGSAIAGLAGLSVVAKCSDGALKASTYMSFLLLLAAGFLMWWSSLASDSFAVSILGKMELSSLPFYLICGGVAIPVVHFGIVILSGGFNATAGAFKGPTVVYQQPAYQQGPRIITAMAKRRLVSDLDLLWRDTIKLLPSSVVKRPPRTLESISQPVDLESNDPETWDRHTLESILVMFATLLALTLYMYYVTRETATTVSSSKTQYIDKKAPVFAKGRRSCHKFSRPRIRVV